MKITSIHMSLLFFFFLNFILFFKLYIIVLVLPNIKMNLPQVYMCFPSWTLLPPPSPFHPSGSSQCTSPKHPVSCIEPGLATRFIYSTFTSGSVTKLKLNQIQQISAKSWSVKQGLLGETAETKHGGNPQGKGSSTPTPIFVSKSRRSTQRWQLTRQNWERIFESSKSSAFSVHCWSFTSEVNPQLYVSRDKKKKKKNMF